MSDVADRPRNALWQVFERWVRAFIRVLGAERPPLDGLASFEDYSRDLTIRMLLVSEGSLVLLALLTWPIDYVLFSRFPDLLHALSLHRLIYVVMSGVFYLTLRQSPWARRHLVATFLLCRLPMAFGLGHSTGMMGGIDSPFLYNLQLTPFASAPLLIRFDTRLLLTILMPLSWLVGFFGLHPEHLRDPLLMVPLDSAAFMCLVSCITGHIFYHLVRENHAQRRRIAERARDLAHLFHHMERKVEEQTRDLRSLAGNLETLQEAERGRISRELHDEMGQLLTGLRLQLSWLHERWAQRQDEPHVERRLRNLVDSVAELQGVARRTIFALRPAALSDLGFPEAVRELARQQQAASGLDIRVGLDDRLAALEEEVGVALFRIIQESITNVVRHARATKVEIQGGWEEGDLLLEIRDDGVGFSQQTPGFHPGWGLLGIRERVRLLGGACSIESAPGKGTAVHIRIPARAARAPAADPSSTIRP